MSHVDDKENKRPPVSEAPRLSDPGLELQGAQLPGDEVDGVAPPVDEGFTFPEINNEVRLTVEY